MKKAGLNRMDKTGFFQTIFEKIRFKARWVPKRSSKKFCRGSFCNLFRAVKKTHDISLQVQLRSAIAEVKGPTNFICYWQIYAIANIEN